MIEQFWEKAKEFHGHQCPGLAIGTKACQGAVERMGVDPAADEELLCITENDACGVDAVQAILGCTMGKGNLILKPTGKQAFTFINRKTGKAMRFYLCAKSGGMEREAYMHYLLGAPVEELFCIKEVSPTVPQRARLFATVICEQCGEGAPEHKIRLQDGKRVCLDCFTDYTRGW